MLRKYRDFLPSYLDGPNIRKHAEIIEKQDMKLYEKLCLLRDWNRLERPILIERVQEEPYNADITVHINTTDIIQRIQIPEMNIDDTFTEEELKTQKTYTKTFTNQQQGQVRDLNRSVMPTVNVTVTLYDGRTYQKSYPENDNPQGTSADHDEMIDFIGNLLGLPRRTYYDIYAPNNEPYWDEVEVYPPWFRKYTSSSDIGKVITEDDYYYMSRIKKLINHYQDSEFAVFMCELLYEWSDLETSSMLERSTCIPVKFVEYANTILRIISPNGNVYPNVNYVNMEDIINQYAPITRPYLIFKPRRTYLYKVYANETELNAQIYPTEPVEVGNINNIGVKLEFKGDSTIPDDCDKVAFMPFTLNTKIGQIDTSPDVPDRAGRPVIAETTVTTEDRTDTAGNYNLDLRGIPPRHIEVNATPTAEDECTPDNEVTPDGPVHYVFKIDPAADLNLDYWEYGIYTGYTGNSPLEPYNDSDYLNTGVGYLVYTQIINYTYGRRNDFSISGTINIGGDNKHFGIIQVIEDDEETIKENDGLFIDLTRYIDTNDYGEHDFSFDFVDEEIYFYLDDVALGVRRNISKDTGMWYIAAYNADTNTSLSLESITTDNNAIYGAYNKINHKYWYVIQGTGTRITPEYSNNQYDIGRRDISVLTDYLILKETVNTTVEIDFNTQTTTNFRIGLILDKTDSVGWYDSYFNAQNDNVTTGDHTLKFVADENGSWKTYIDNTRTSNTEFTLNNDRNIGAINYQAQKVKIKEIRIYKNST